jgi:hypothetical protein
LLERDPELAALAARNAGLNDMAGRVTALPAMSRRGPRSSRLGRAPLLRRGRDEPALLSAGGSRASPVPNRKAAHVAGGLAPWLRRARTRLLGRAGISR